MSKLLWHFRHWFFCAAKPLMAKRSKVRNRKTMMPRRVVMFFESGFTMRFITNWITTIPESGKKKSRVKRIVE